MEIRSQSTHGDLKAKHTWRFKAGAYMKIKIQSIPGDLMLGDT